MQFYIQLWVDTGLTLSDLGEWETRNPEEYEVYMSAYSERINRINKQRKK